MIVGDLTQTNGKCARILQRTFILREQQIPLVRTFLTMNIFEVIDETKGFDSPRPADMT